MNLLVPFSEKQLLNFLPFEFLPLLSALDNNTPFEKDQSFEIIAARGGERFLQLLSHEMFLRSTFGTAKASTFFLLSFLLLV